MVQNSLTEKEAKIIENSLEVMYYALMSDTIKLRAERDKTDGAFKKEEINERIVMSENETRLFNIESDKIRAKLINLTEVK
jgi:hypothetical protein